MNKLLAGAAAVAGLALAANAQAAPATLSGAVSADNQYWAYISSSDTTLGTLIGSGDNWGSADSLTSTALTGGTYYLHIVAENWALSSNTPTPGDPAIGNPDGIIGQFSLSGAGYQFANGSTTLVTDTADWRATGQTSAGAAWSAPTGSLISEGAYGVGPWGSISGLPAGTSAQWVWSSTDPSGVAFFSTTISAVPEPATWAMMILGVAMIGFAARRRREGVALAA